MSAAINSRSSRIMGILTAVLCCLMIAVTPVKALAAPADGATVQYSGTSGTVTWEIYTDGTLVIRPTEGDEGTMESLSGSYNGVPWTAYASRVKRIETQGTVHLGSNAKDMFAYFTNCTYADLSGMDTSSVTDMSYMFEYFGSADYLDLTGWNTSNVTNMEFMFYECKAKNIDTSGWDTSSVTTMKLMFGNSKSTSINMSGWDTSNVTDMNSMFTNCKAASLEGTSGWDVSAVTTMYCMFTCCGVTELDLSDWDTSSVTIMDRMFSTCSGLTSLDVSGFDTSNVTNMSQMFCNCPKLTSLDVSGFETGNVTNIGYMFSGCSGLTSIDVSGFETENVTNMAGIFSNCSKLISVDVSGFETGNVTNMASMFNNCRVLTSLDVSGFDTGKVTDMNGMFQNCYKITSLDVSGFDTGKVTNMNNMFKNCSGLTSLDVSRFDTGNVTNMGSMFSNCSKLTSIDVSGFETENVTNMAGMFNNCVKLTSLDVSGFDTGEVTDMGSMFSNCSKLTSPDVSGFNTGNVTNMGYMFLNCHCLTSVDVSTFDTGNVTNMDSMFTNCSSLTSLDLSGFNTGNVTDMSDMFGGCSGLTGVTLGEDFSFKGKNITSTSRQAILPTPPYSTTTGKWVREDGTVEAKTPTELRDQYDANAAAWAGKWVWEEAQTKYTIKFNPPAGGGYAGSMPDQKIKAAEAGTLNANAFSRFDYSFDYWDGSDGRTYTDGQTIPANTFNVGDTLTLTAVFTKDRHVLNFIDGVAEFTLKAGEKAVFSDLPGGSKYQIWEETPSGWQLIDQTNAAGTVVPNQTTDASFTNEYVPGTATFTLMAQKTLDGMLPGDGQFEFELIGADNTVVQTVSNNAAGIVQFDQIVFRQPGTYVYQIREVRGDDPGISYDAHTEVVTITVSDDGHGNLTATSSSMTTLPSFENETKPGMLTVEKKVEGGNSGQIFTFEIELTNDKGMPLSNVHVVGETAE